MEKRKLKRERGRERRDEELIEETERKEKKRSKRKFDKLRVVPRSTWVDWGNIVNKSKSSRVGIQKHDEMTKSVSSRIPIPIMSRIFVQNVSSCFNRIRPAGILEVFVGEES